MASPARIARPVVTYQRSRPGSSTNTGTGAGTGAGTGTKTSTRTLDELLDPEAALHAKIASALQDPSPNGNENRLAANALRRLEDDFDSAYLETEGNAKKMHDLVEVGETRRFADELEYMLDGLEGGKKETLLAAGNVSLCSASPRLWNLPLVRSCLRDIYGRCFESEGDRSFGLRLKSHGILGRIVDALAVECPFHGSRVCLLEDDESRRLLALLVHGLLGDVRRLDFFVPVAAALQLAHWALIEGKMGLAAERGYRTALSSPMLKDLDPDALELTIGMWFMLKATSSSARIVSSSAAYQVVAEHLLQHPQSIRRLAELSVDTDLETFVGEKAAALLDVLISGWACELPDLDSLVPEGLLERMLLSAPHRSAVLSCLVSVTGTSIGRCFLAKEHTASASPWRVFVGLWETVLGRELLESQALLLLSALVNLVDRADDRALESARMQRLGSGVRLLDSMAAEFEGRVFAEGKDLQQSQMARLTLLALLLAFTCRRDRSSLGIMQAAWREAAVCMAKMKELLAAFVSQHRKQLTVMDDEQSSVLELLDGLLSSY